MLEIVRHQLRRSLVESQISSDGFYNDFVKGLDHYPSMMPYKLTQTKRIPMPSLLVYIILNVNTWMI